MYMHFDHYGKIADTTGFKTSQALSAATFAASTIGFWNLPLPLREPPQKRISSIIVHPRATVSTFRTKLYLFGCPSGEWRMPKNWYGPVGVYTVSSTQYPVATKTIGGTTWYCAPSVQMDTQDMQLAAMQVTVDGTSNNANWAGTHGIQFDVDVQDATA